MLTLIKLPLKIAVLSSRPALYGMVQPLAKAQVSWHSSPQDIAHLLNDEDDSWNALRQLLTPSINSQHRVGANRLSRIAADHLCSNARATLTTTILVEASNEAAGNLQAIHKTGQLHERRVCLLGGINDEVDAIQAFNAGLIHRYLSISSKTTQESINNAISKLHKDTCVEISNTIRGGLNRPQHELLTDPHRAECIEQLITDQGWTEYIVIPTPFGILGTNNQQLQWLQLETSESLKDLAELASVEGRPRQLVADIEQGDSMINPELHFALRLAGTSTVASAVEKHPALNLYIGIFEVKLSS